MPTLRYGNDPKKWPKPNIAKIVKVCEDVGSKNGWMGQRNSAILSTLPLFGSRASENSYLRKENVQVGPDTVFVTFSILKMHHTKKVRCSCGRLVKFGWNNCPICGSSLKGIEPLPQKEQPTDIQRQRKRNHPLTKFFTDWVEQVPSEAWIFPKTSVPGIFHTETTQPLWDKRLSRQGIYMIVRRNLEDYWPHLFRHSLATGFSQLGFSESDLMKWFGWTRYETAERYTRLGGGARIKSMGETSV